MPSFRKVDVRLPGKVNSNSHGARPIHLITTIITWIRTSRLSKKNSLSGDGEVVNDERVALDQPRIVLHRLPFASQFKNTYSAEMCSGSEAGLYLRLIDFCITQLKAQGPSRTCNESKYEEESSARSAAHCSALPAIRFNSVHTSN